MGSVFFIVLRRMRAPLITLIVIYAVSVLGLVLIPGVDASGKPAPPMSFFHAFYFVSYTASTIGFGEIPAAFSDPQRMWATATIYLSVIGWTYSILTILALFSDRGFQQALAASRFRRRVARIAEPFYLICGCGETGGLLIHALDRIDRRCVVVESDEARIVELELEDFRTDAPALVADASQPQTLLLAGLRHPWCRGVLALTNQDAANLAIAAAVRLLNPGMPLLCRAELADTVERMTGFGADYIFNPFEVFGRLLAQALHAPARYRLHRWLTGTPGTCMSTGDDPPRGRWIVCGYGRFGRSVVSWLVRGGMELTLIDPDVKAAPGFRVVAGSGIEEAVLREAGVAEAVGFVAGTDDDINNLSIAMAARRLNPELFMVVRQNQQARRELFEAYAPDLAVVPSEIVGHACLALLTTPLLPVFLRQMEQQDDEWARSLLARMRLELGDDVPESWSVRLDAVQAAAADAWLERRASLPLAALLTNPAARESRLACVPLLLRRDCGDHLVPTDSGDLRAGDEILFAGTHGARVRQQLILRNANALAYVLTGRETQSGWLWGWLLGRLGRPPAGAA
ncbi:MAG: NAD-binding protein [Sulfuritalea sp.]|nr:NAD-binding protein [Sulfuritalea sp.]